LANVGLVILLLVIFSVAVHFFYTRRRKDK
jgi:hypothetical protein